MTLIWSYYFDTAGDRLCNDKAKQLQTVLGVCQKKDWALLIWFRSLSKIKSKTNYPLTIPVSWFYTFSFFGLHWFGFGLSSLQLKGFWQLHYMSIYQALSIWPRAWSLDIVHLNSKDIAQWTMSSTIHAFVCPLLHEIWANPVLLQLIECDRSDTVLVLDLCQTWIYTTATSTSCFWEP